MRRITVRLARPVLTHTRGGLRFGAARALSRGSVQADPVDRSRVTPPSWLAVKDVADVFVIQPRSRKQQESHEEAGAALDEAVSLVRAIPHWRVVGEAERAVRPSSTSARWPL